MTWRKVLKNFIIACAFFFAGFSIWWIHPEPYYWEVIFNWLMAGFGFFLMFRVLAPIWATIIYRASGNRLPFVDVEEDAVTISFFEKYFAIKPKI